MFSTTIRGRNNRRVGVLVAEKPAKDIVVAWSLCNTNEDKFDYQKGLDIATKRLERAVGCKNRLDVDWYAISSLPVGLIPENVQKYLVSSGIVSRLRRYFYDYKAPVCIQTKLAGLSWILEDPR